VLEQQGDSMVFAYATERTPEEGEAQWSGPVPGYASDCLLHPEGPLTGARLFC